MDMPVEEIEDLLKLAGEEPATVKAQKSRNNHQILCDKNGHP